jgi:hypothetical protein
VCHAIYPDSFWLAKEFVFCNVNVTDHKEGEQLEDRRNVGENSCNSGDGTDQTGPILDVYDDDDVAELQSPQK